MEPQDVKAKRWNTMTGKEKAIVVFVTIVLCAITIFILTPSESPKQAEQTKELAPKTQPAEHNWTKTSRLFATNKLIEEEKKYGLPHPISKQTEPNPNTVIYTLEYAKPITKDQAKIAAELFVFQAANFMNENYPEIWKHDFLIVTEVTGKDGRRYGRAAFKDGMNNIKYETD